MDVRLSRPHLKFLSGNYLTYGTRAIQSGGSPHCRICPSGREETVSHVISTCMALAGERNRLLSEYRRLCNLTKNCINFDKILENEKQLCQFILDPTSLNLPERVSLNDPTVTEFYKLSRDYCTLLDKTRVRRSKITKNENRFEKMKINLSRYHYKLLSVMTFNTIVIVNIPYTKNNILLESKLWIPILSICINFLIILSSVYIFQSESLLDNYFTIISILEPPVSTVFQISSSLSAFVLHFAQWSLFYFFHF